MEVAIEEGDDRRTVLDGRLRVTKEADKLDVSKVTMTEYCNVKVLILDWQRIFKSPNYYLDSIITDEEIESNFRYEMPDELREE